MGLSKIKYCILGVIFCVIGCSSVQPTDTFCQNYSLIILTEKEADSLSDSTVATIYKDDMAYETLCIAPKYGKL